MNDDKLAAARDAAWIDYTDFDAEVYQPRFYKQRVGKKLQYINPWASNEEREDVRRVLMEKRDTWFKYHLGCQLRKIPPISEELTFRWILQSTPDGDRYVRRT